MSAGLLVYRKSDAGVLEVLVVHPGGPLWSNKDDGAWSIPKGEVEGDADPEATADREFAEEIGAAAPSGPRIDLGQVTQRSGKRVRAWAVAGDLDVTVVRSNTFEIEWPRGSGRIRSFPEVDAAAWFTVADARRKLIAAQGAFLDRLAAALDGDDSSEWS
ncbi:MAG TPA: NUDIX domain-containing protein [Acidimicrobiales bacterium]|nr:NUDIX domain-containing protein [Acidimicrobiales bacterium]